MHGQILRLRREHAAEDHKAGSSSTPILLLLKEMNCLHHAKQAWWEILRVPKRTLARHSVGKVKNLCLLLERKVEDIGL